MRTGIYATIVVILGVLGVNLFFFFGSSPAAEQLHLSPIEPLVNTTQAYIFPLSEPSYLPILNTSVRPPVLSAKAAVAYDVRSGRLLFSQSPRQQLPVASITKALTAATVFDMLDMEDIATVGSGSVRVDGISQDLYRDERISVRSLVRLMLIKSSNDAAAALTAHAASLGIDLVAAMNEKARSWGMADSLFLDPAGLDDNAYSTAKDIARMARQILKYPLITDIMREQSAVVTSADRAIEHRIENTNQLLGEMPGIIGGKTGYTDQALGCLLLMLGVPGQHDTIAYVILGSTARFDDARKLAAWVDAAYRWE